MNVLRRLEHLVKLLKLKQEHYKTFSISNGVNPLVDDILNEISKVRL